MSQFSRRTSVLFVVVYCLIHLGSSEIDYQQCDGRGVHFYEQLGCTPNKMAAGQCPVSYDCPDYVIPNGKCLFYGEELNNGDIANGSYCNRGYECEATPDSKGYFRNSLIIDCFFGPPPDGCYRGGDLRSCCQSDICPTGDVYTCQVGNTTYKEGERFTPEGTCWNCVCKPGFRGVFEEPFCMRRPCDTELRNAKELEEKCAPVFYKDGAALCCPRNFICPDAVISMKVTEKGAESTEKCEFKNMKYNIGDQINAVYNSTWNASLQTKANCSCLIPPYLACN